MGLSEDMTVWVYWVRCVGMGLGRDVRVWVYWIR